MVEIINTPPVLIDERHPVAIQKSATPYTVYFRFSKQNGSYFHLLKYISKCHKKQFSKYGTKMTTNI